MVQDAIIVSLCLFRNAPNHALTHLQKTIELQALAFPYIRIVISGLDHQEQIEVLIALGIIVESI